MSSSMPRTTPACTSSCANWSGSRAGPATYTSAPPGVTPTPERHWFSIPAPEQDDTPHVAAPHEPVRVRGLRRRLAAFHERDEVLAHCDDVRGHRDVAAPGAHGDRTVGTDHERGGPVHERVDRAALGDVAALGVLHEEATVERGDQRRRLRRLDRRGEHVRAATGALRARIELGAEQVRVHPGDPGFRRPARRHEVCFVDGREPVDGAAGRRPRPVRRRRGRSERCQRCRGGQWSWAWRRSGRGRRGRVRRRRGARSSGSGTGRRSARRCCAARRQNEDKGQDADESPRPRDPSSACPREGRLHEPVSGALRRPAPARSCWASPRSCQRAPGAIHWREA